LANGRAEIRANEPQRCGDLTGFVLKVHDMDADVETPLGLKRS
jgi:hypothetical protein